MVEVQVHDAMPEQQFVASRAGAVEACYRTAIDDGVLDPNELEDLSVGQLPGLDALVEAGKLVNPLSLGLQPRNAERSAKRPSISHA